MTGQEEGLAIEDDKRTEGESRAQRAAQAVAEHDRRAAATSVGLRTFQAQAHANYRYIWLGQVSHTSAMWMEQVARA